MTDQGKQARDEQRVTTDEQNRQAATVTLTVPSHPKFLYVVRSALYPIVNNAGFSKKETRMIILAIDEACSNIIKYAYEGDPTKPISLVVTVSGGELRIELKDRGKRVDVTKIAPRKLADVRPGGLGTHFMHTVFDTVHYDTSGEQGTVLTLVKKRP
jgi:anti-sigma regulatory factor (Ser/Thr protein kinase)